MSRIAWGSLILGAILFWAIQKFLLKRTAA